MTSICNYHLGRKNELILSIWVTILNQFLIRAFLDEIIWHKLDLKRSSLIILICQTNIWQAKVFVYYLVILHIGQSIHHRLNYLYYLTFSKMILFALILFFIPIILESSVGYLTLKRFMSLQIVCRVINRCKSDRSTERESLTL
jgi:hypothetical protein